jgi:deoxyribodipyrimidine photo-lyase
MNITHPVAIWWIRRDLRLTDNPALTAALNNAAQIVPTFVLDPSLLGSAYVGEKRLAFLFEGLRSLQASLERLGSGLVVRRGDPEAVLTLLAAETGATAVYAQSDFSPYARNRDARVGKSLPLVLTEGVTVFPPDAVQKPDGSPYTVFTPYSKAWKSLPRPATTQPAPNSINTPQGINSDGIPVTPALPAEVPFLAREEEAQRRLQEFTNSPPIFNYGDQRDRMDLDGTSRLSPYLRFGMISARQVALAAQHSIEQATGKATEKSAVVWLNEIIWREFFTAILYNFPQVRSSNFQQKFDAFQWEDDPTAFDAWCAGQTGYPVVDAAIRQLRLSGWMHNRARMIVASFLVKHLLIDWRHGERFFMRHLIDGDPAANNGGWQWSAGTGTDAAPYFRVFNPILQGQKFDPAGDYVRRWVPELAQVPTQHIHTPWTMPLAIQRNTGCKIGKDYPAPIVDHSQARARALARFTQIKNRKA